MSKTAEKKTLVEVFALWRKKSNDGKKTYFTGIFADKTDYLTAFYNLEKKNLKEPDIRVYVRDDEGNLSAEPFVSLWCNATKNGKKVLSGKIDGKRVIGFINNGNDNQPYIRVYWSDELQEEKQEAPKPEKETKKAKTAKKKEEEIPEDDSLPF